MSAFNAPRYIRALASHRFCPFEAGILHLRPLILSSELAKKVSVCRPICVCTWSQLELVFSQKVLEKEKCWFWLRAH